jgi:lysozyme
VTISPDKVAARCRKEEDERLESYDDETGKQFISVKLRGNATIGCGHLMSIDDRFKGMSEKQLAIQVICQTTCDKMLSEDVQKAMAAVDSHIPWAAKLPENQQLVLVDMCFNMGVHRLLKFEHMLEALHVGDAQKAAAELMDSDYGRGVTKNRATRNRELLLA